MDLKEKIKVMEHFANGGKVETREKESNEDWKGCDITTWNWGWFDFRIKEEKPTITIEKWLCIDEDGDYDIINVSNIDKYRQYEKIKLIETYEVEL